MNVLNLKIVNRILDFIQSAYIINSFFVTLFFFTLVLIGQNDVAIKIIYYSSVSIFVTQIFSINARNIGITDDDIGHISKNLSLRITITPLLFLISILSYKYLLNEELNKLLIYTNLIIYLIWIFELCLALIEVKKKPYLVLFYYIYFLAVFITIFFINDKNINTFIFYVLFSKFILVFFILTVFKFKITHYKNNIFNIKISNLQQNFFSSLSLTSLNLLIRLILYKFYNFDNLEIIYLCISIYSLPGSLVTSSFGASFFPLNKSIPLIFKFIINTFMIFILIISFNLLFFENLDTIKIYKIHLSLLYLNIALISGVFQYLGQSIRIIRLSNKYFRINLLEADMIFSILGTINLLIFVFFLQEILIYMIFINSIISMSIYLGYKRNKIHKL